MKVFSQVTVAGPDDYAYSVSIAMKVCVWGRERGGEGREGEGRERGGEGEGRRGGREGRGGEGEGRGSMRKYNLVHVCLMYILGNMQADKNRMGSTTSYV